MGGFSLARSAGRRRSMRVAAPLPVHPYDPVDVGPPPPIDPTLYWFTQTFRLDKDSMPPGATWPIGILGPGDFDEAFVGYLLDFDNSTPFGELQRPLQAFRLNMRFRYPPPLDFHLDVRFNRAWTPFVIGTPWTDYINVTDYELNIAYGSEVFRTWIDPAAHPWPDGAPPPPNPTVTTYLAYGGVWPFLRGTTTEAIEIVHIEYQFWRGV